MVHCIHHLLCNYAIDLIASYALSFNIFEVAVGGYAQLLDCRIVSNDDAGTV